jgi:H+/gluconate symporter-like permease
VSVIGVSIGIGIVLFVFLFIKKRKKRKTKQRESSSIQLQPEQQKVTQNNEKNITYLELQEYPTSTSLHFSVQFHRY